MTIKTLYELGEAPPLGVVPPQMYAWVIRRERFGEPTRAFQIEVVPTPPLGDDDVLIYVMASGINYNCVWAALGIPIDVISIRQAQGEQEDFHIGGSEASGIVYAVGRNVRNVRVGDAVVAHGGDWNGTDDLSSVGGDSVLSPSFRAWGYESNWGAFGQFARARAHQCLPKPPQLSWAEAACYQVSGPTAYRMLLGWPPHTLRQGDVALIWGGAGGLGSMAIQLARAVGARPVAVVSSAEKDAYCRSIGAVGCVDRTRFDHWGPLPDWDDEPAYERWLRGARAFGKAIWEAVGERANPQIVLEHTGQDTMPTSLFVCSSGGMVVTCGATSGYNGTLDLRYLWTRQKRLQGSHYADHQQAEQVNRMVVEGLVKPTLSQTFAFQDLAYGHQLMYEHRHPCGNMAVLINALDQK